MQYVYRGEIRNMNKNSIYVGIHPGEVTGVATYDPIKKTLLTVRSILIDDVEKYVNELTMINEVYIFIENNDNKYFKIIKEFILRKGLNAEICKQQIKLKQNFKQTLRNKTGYMSHVELCGAYSGLLVYGR